MKQDISVNMYQNYVINQVINYFIGQLEMMIKIKYHLNVKNMMMFIEC